MRKPARQARGPLGAAPALILLVLALLCSCGKTDEPAQASLSGLQARLEELAALAPERTELGLLGHGTSTADRAEDDELPIYSLRIRGSSWAEGDPRVQVIGAIHGNESMGTELCLALAGLALGAEGQAVPEALASTYLVVVPVANPYGYGKDSRYVVGYQDPNRAFPMDYLADGSGTAPAWPELLALTADARSSRYAMSISLHTGAYRICIPWDYIGTTASDSADSDLDSYSMGSYVDLYSPAHPWFVAAGARYAALVESATGAGAGSYPSVQGYDWYYAGGTYGDWLYLRLGTAPFTIELGYEQGKDETTAAVVERAVATHLDALVDLIGQAGLGAKGRVADASGAGIPGARIVATPLSIGSRAAWVDPEKYEPFAYTDEAGYFRIAVQGGEWSLAVSAVNFASKSVSIEVEDSGLSALTTIVLSPG